MSLYQRDEDLRVFRCPADLCAAARAVDLKHRLRAPSGLFDSNICSRSILNIHHGQNVVNILFSSIPDLSKVAYTSPIGDTISLDTAPADTVKQTGIGMRLRSCLGAWRYALLSLAAYRVLFVDSTLAKFRNERIVEQAIAPLSR